MDGCPPSPSELPPSDPYPVSVRIHAHGQPGPQNTHTHTAGCATRTLGLLLVHVGREQGRRRLLLLLLVVGHRVLPRCGERRQQRGLRYRLSRIVGLRGGLRGVKRLRQQRRGLSARPRRALEEARRASQA
jgi:hypothetical protein